jgi:hypothetical protein
LADLAWLAICPSVSQVREKKKKKKKGITQFKQLASFMLHGNLGLCATR